MVESRLDSLGFLGALRHARERGPKLSALILALVSEKGHAFGRFLKYPCFVLHDPVPEALVNEALEFPWQQTLLEAFIEWRPNYLPAKIDAAEDAIAARFCEPTDLNEQLALGDALQTLRLLFSKEVSTEKFTN
jgi:hypothetical protein